MNKDRIGTILKRQNLVSGDSITFKPLEGGVSSDICLVSDGQNKYVIKQALSQLQVDDEWYADRSRNEIEQEFMQYLDKHRPGAVPRLIYNDREEQFFVMEYLDQGFQNWKQQMLGGHFNEKTARQAAELLADIHTSSHGDEALKRKFDNIENFYSLRIEPYLVTTGVRHPALEACFVEEAERLRKHRTALIHGDFSPKNIMTKEDRVVILDHEVAWYGDPAFDLAFFLNHLHLKLLHHYFNTRAFRDLTGTARNAYFNQLGAVEPGLEERTGRLLLMMMLARVDGKSPVEYLSTEEQKFVRQFVYDQLPEQGNALPEITATWKSKLKETFV
ncbi:MAG: aminoglycoside phosphotransferase family protein [Balneolaceae bacterium]|nr:aminoglycoside phosphotransferase family protein [Balneolaceae bacterium]